MEIFWRLSTDFWQKIETFPNFNSKKEPHTLHLNVGASKPKENFRKFSKKWIWSRDVDEWCGFKAKKLKLWFDNNVKEYQWLGKSSWGTSYPIEPWNIVTFPDWSHILIFFYKKTLLFLRPQVRISKFQIITYSRYN